MIEMILPDGSKRQLENPMTVVEFAKSIGLDMIITDHHEMQEELPEAVAVVDLKRKDIEIDGFKDIAGCFVAFKLVEAIATELRTF